MAALEQDGFQRFGFDPSVADWARAAIGPALGIAADPHQQARWLRGKGTWFVGVDALGNDRRGAVAGVALKGAVIERLHGLGWAPEAWHQAQISVVYEGYPKAVDGESAAATRFRLKRDAAHLDGLLPVGPDRHRKLREPHSFVLGIPLNDPPQGASPLVVWRGSHHVIGAALHAAFAGVDPVEWENVSLTDVYQAARRHCFDLCERVELPVRVGEATLLHRHMLHGVAPWTAGAFAEGRIIAYFRPQLGSVADWIAMTP